MPHFIRSGLSHIIFGFLIHVFNCKVGRSTSNFQKNPNGKKKRPLIKIGKLFGFSDTASNDQSTNKRKEEGKVSLQA